MNVRVNGDGPPDWDKRIWQIRLDPRDQLLAFCHRRSATLSLTIIFSSVNIPDDVSVGDLWIFDKFLARVSVVGTGRVEWVVNFPDDTNVFPRSWI